MPRKGRALLYTTFAVIPAGSPLLEGEFAPILPPNLEFSHAKGILYRKWNG